MNACTASITADRGESVVIVDVCLRLVLQLFFYLDPSSNCISKIQSRLDYWKRLELPLFSNEYSRYQTQFGNALLAKLSAKKMAEKCFEMSLQLKVIFLHPKNTCPLSS